MIRSLALVAALALTAAPLAASADPAAAGQQTTAAKASTAPPDAPSQGKASDAVAKNKIVCRHLELTGTRLGGSRVCKTEAQWEDETRQSRSDLEDMTNRALRTTCPVGASCG